MEHLEGVPVSAIFQQARTNAELPVVGEVVVEHEESNSPEKEMPQGIAVSIHDRSPVPLHLDQSRVSSHYLKMS